MSLHCSAPRREHRRNTNYEPEAGVGTHERGGGGARGCDDYKFVTPTNRENRINHPGLEIHINPVAQNRTPGEIGGAD